MAEVDTDSASRAQRASVIDGLIAHRCGYKQECFAMSKYSLNSYSYAKKYEKTRARERGPPLWPHSWAV